MFNIPNLFTAANMMSGVFAVIFALCGRIDIAPFCIFMGAVFDFLDGFLARQLKVSGELGKQLDSLADMITFGVAPGIIMMVLLIYCGELELNGFLYSMPSSVSVSVWLNDLFDGNTGNYLPFIGLIIPFFSLFRLAKFNLDARQTDSFIGLNTPANTLFLMSFPLVYVYQFPDPAMAKVLFNPIFIACSIIIMSLMLVSELPFFSLKIKGFGWIGNEIRYIFLLISLLFIVFFKAWSLALIVFLYLILSLIENKILKRTQNEV
ncbi:MAG: CDP-alcohol phosphatidyltransferase family protein [Crocinitomicaceae bacterium]|nr:CDP-alcohol phosphatidyltransferase family protein [Crocinitomicaceae bacterium]